MMLPIGLAVAGLTASLMFAQTSKHMTVGAFSAVCAFLFIPAAIALLWRLSQLVGWWTIAIFLATSLVVGIANGVIAMRLGTRRLYALQPVLGVTFIALTVACWMVGKHHI